VGQFGYFMSGCDGLKGDNSSRWDHCFEGHRSKHRRFAGLQPCVSELQKLAGGENGAPTSRRLFPESAPWCDTGAEFQRDGAQIVRASLHP